MLTSGLRSQVSALCLIFPEMSAGAKKKNQELQFELIPFISESGSSIVFSYFISAPLMSIHSSLYEYQNISCSEPLCSSRYNIGVTTDVH